MGHYRIFQGVISSRLNLLPFLLSDRVCKHFFLIDLKFDKGAKAPL